MAILFFATSFLRGLFFDKDFYLIHVLVFLLFTVQVVRAFINKDKIPTSFYAVFLVPIGYLISLFVSESTNSALNQLFRWLDYAAFFILLLSVSKDKKVKSMMPYIFAFLGAVLSIFAVLAFYHVVDFKDAIILDPNGDKRFTSTFQYANTFAAVIGAFWLFTLVWITDSSATRLKVFLLSLPLLFYGLDFLHSYSRGALLLFPLAWIVGLLLLPFSRQILYFIYTLISVAGGLILFKKDSNPILLIVLVALSAGLIFVIDFSLKGRIKLLRLDRIKFSQFFISILALLGGVLLFLDIVYKGFIFEHLPLSLQERLGDISLGTYSVQGRNLFYHDAMKISGDHPLLGVGGSGWKVLFTHVQDLPYWSNETHNGYLEVLLSTGWMGFILFLTVFAFLFYRVYQGYRSSYQEEKLLATMALPALVMIFAHSFIDFNFSYGTVWYIVLFLFAMAVDRSLPKDFLISKPAIHYSLLSFLLIFVAVFSIYTLRFYSAVREETVLGQTMKFEDVQSIAKKNPYDVKYQISLANAYLQMLEKNHDPKYKDLVLSTNKYLESLEPNNAMVMYNLGMLNARLGQYDQSMNYFKKTLEFDHYNAQYYNDIIDIKSQLMQAYIKNKNKAEAQKYADSILVDYQTINNWMIKMQDKKLNPLQINERNFSISSADKLHAAQALYYEKKYNQVIPLVEEIKKDKDQEIKKQALALLAATYEVADKAQLREIIKTNDFKTLKIQPIYANYLSTYR